MYLTTRDCLRSKTKATINASNMTTHVLASSKNVGLVNRAMERVAQSCDGEDEGEPKTKVARSNDAKSRVKSVKCVDAQKMPVTCVECCDSVAYQARKQNQRPRTFGFMPAVIGATTSNVVMPSTSNLLPVRHTSRNTHSGKMSLDTSTNVVVVVVMFDTVVVIVPGEDSSKRGHTHTHTEKKSEHPIQMDMKRQCADTILQMAILQGA